MPRKDPTFTDSDLLRFYCRNVDPGEKYLVMKAFNDHIKKGIKICPDDPDERIDPCEWIQKLKELLNECGKKAVLLVQIIKVLVTLEVVLSGLSWVGPAARILKIVVIVIGYLVSVLIFVATILTLLSQLGGPLLTYLNDYFCTGAKPLPLPKPPDVVLPEDPQRRMDEIIDWIESIFDWLSPSDTDNLPPELLPGP